MVGHRTDEEHAAPSRCKARGKRPTHQGGGWGFPPRGERGAHGAHRPEEGEQGGGPDGALAQGRPQRQALRRQQPPGRPPPPCTLLRPTCPRVRGAGRRPNSSPCFSRARRATGCSSSITLESSMIADERQQGRCLSRREEAGWGDLACRRGRHPAVLAACAVPR